VYHSQEPTIASWHAKRAKPDAIHVVTCRDPRGFAEHIVELRHTTWKRRVLFPATWLYEASPLVRSAVRRADEVLMPTPTHLGRRIRELYGVEARFVPSPVDLPERPATKADDPLALFVGRWDRRKRVERFFELARAFPDVRFVAAGRAHDSSYDAELRNRGGQLPNVEMPGFLDRFEDDRLERLYEQAWVLVNTSAREGLPYSFIEAAAWGCAILSGLDPEGFASRFGRHIDDDDSEEWERALRDLLDGAWRERGSAGRDFVHSIWGEEASVRRHLEVYVAAGGGR
jgi:glycosyltransferase involved in cell wall biosynthesis